MNDEQNTEQTTEQITADAQAEETNAKANEESMAPDVDMLADYLADLDGDEVVLLYELIGAIDPLRTENGLPYYSTEQRRLIMGMAETYQDAGYGE